MCFYTRSFRSILSFIYFIFYIIDFIKSTHVLYNNAPFILSFYSPKTDYFVVIPIKNAVHCDTHIALHPFFNKVPLCLVFYNKLIAVIIHEERLTRLDVPLDDLLRNQGFDLALEETLQRARTVDRVITAVYNERLGFRRQLHAELLIRQTAL